MELCFPEMSEQERRKWW
ncbi:hypothetical protein ACLK1S_06550 [Escherichia coli]